MAQTKQPHRRQSRPVPPFRAVRKAQGLGLRETARRAELDPAHLSKVERGLASLSIDSLGRLARALGLRDLERLLTPYVRERELDLKPDGARLKGGEPLKPGASI